MTLYDMTETAAYLYRLLEDGEIDEQTVADSLEGMCVEDKLEDYCKVIRQFEADAEAYNAEKARLDKKKKRAERAIERLTERVKNFMVISGKDQKKCGVFDISITTSKKAQVVNIENIPEIYLKPQPPAVDLAAIRTELIGGKEIPGAALQINRNIKIK